jgi:hypothetical protein
MRSFFLVKLYEYGNSGVISGYCVTTLMAMFNFLKYFFVIVVNAFSVLYVRDYEKYFRRKLDILKKYRQLDFFSFNIHKENCLLSVHILGMYLWI